MQSSEVYEGFDREKSFGVKLNTPSHFHGQIRLHIFKLYVAIKVIQATTDSNMKTCGKTKVWVLDPNLASKIS